MIVVVGIRMGFVEFFIKISINLRFNIFIFLFRKYLCLLYCSILFWVLNRCDEELVDSNLILNCVMFRFRVRKRCKRYFSSFLGS